MSAFTRNYLQTLSEVLEAERNPLISAKQKAYMKDHFSFIGIMTTRRREILKPFLTRDALPEKNVAFEIIRQCWMKHEREYHYFAQELLACYKRQWEVGDIDIMEWMITHQSWWDTVDMIAVHLVGSWNKKFPAEGNKVRKRWLNSNHMWLQRASLIYQLMYKEQTDSLWLSTAVEKLMGGKEFFINKAIGWALRSYSVTNPKWVLNFVDAHPGLSNLSKKEAVRLVVG